jgi:ParB-like chromosome segregation protein Spo0J
MNYEIHPICAAYPWPPEADVQKMAESMKISGQLDPITLYEGKVLDGKVRLKACEIAGLEPRTSVYEGNDPIRFVIAKNEQRRHLTHTQRLAIAAALCGLAHGANRYRKLEVSIDTSNFSREEAAKKLDVPLGSLTRRIYLKQHAAPNIIEMVDSDEIALHTAYEGIRGVSKEDQAGFTAADLSRRGREITRKRKQASQQPTRVITPIQRHSAGPVPMADRGLPEDPRERQAHIERYGRTPLWVPAAHDLLEMKQQCRIVAAAIHGVATGHGVTPENLFENITRMLAWIRQPEKKHGQQIDFARAGRELRADLKRDVPRAIAYLQSVADWLESEGNGRGQEDRSEAGKCPTLQ